MLKKPQYCYHLCEHRVRVCQLNSIAVTAKLYYYYYIAVLDCAYLTIGCYGVCILTALSDSCRVIDTVRLKTRSLSFVCLHVRSCRLTLVYFQPNAQ